MDEDMRMYTMAINDIKLQPVQGSCGTYHLKNGSVYCGYTLIPIVGFSESKYAWEIFH